jgi:hypothetical protein
MGKDQSGTSLERLISVLEGLLAGKGAKIEVRSRRLRSRANKQPREHDVLITWDHGHHQIITAIECRDRTRKVGVADVEAFSKKCELTKVHQGVIASASGFYDSARKVAEDLNIGCMELTDGYKFDWIDAVTFVEDRQTFGIPDINVVIAGMQPSEIAEIRNPYGVVVSDTFLESKMMEIASSFSHLRPEDEGTASMAFHVDTGGCVVIDPKGVEFPISHFEVKVTRTVERRVHLAKPYLYRGQGKKYPFAKVDLDLGLASGSMILLQDTADHVGVFWQPDRRNKRA